VRNAKWLANVTKRFRARLRPRESIPLIISVRRSRRTEGFWNIRFSFVPSWRLHAREKLRSFRRERFDQKGMPLPQLHSHRGKHKIRGYERMKWIALFLPSPSSLFPRMQNSERDERYREYSSSWQRREPRTRSNTRKGDYPKP